MSSSKSSAAILYDTHSDYQWTVFSFIFVIEIRLGAVKPLKVQRNVFYLI